MPNPFKQAQMKQNNDLKQIDMTSLINNPNQVMELINKQSPQLYQLLKSGGNPEIMVRQICQQRGIDLNQFMNNLFGGNNRY